MNSLFSASNDSATAMENRRRGMSAVNRFSKNCFVFHS